MRRLAVFALLLFTSVFLTQAWAEEREEFHQTYPLSATGRVSLHNVNGAVHVTAWDRNEVKVDAIKKARTEAGLKEAQIVVDAKPDAVEINTKYPEHGSHDGATVEYTLSVPRQAALDKISTVNGAVDLAGLAGEVKASSVNGAVQARQLTGDTKLSTVNGRIEADFERLTAKAVSLKTVNGGITITLPANAGAQLDASTVHGGVNSDFDLPVRHVGFAPGSHLETTIGGGGTAIHLSTVNGGITLRRR